MERAGENLWPPESDGPRPFVSAGKSNAELKGANLVIYPTNTFDVVCYHPEKMLAVDPNPTASIVFPNISATGRT